jgi:hypothetical protein
MRTERLMFRTRRVALAAALALGAASCGSSDDVTTPPPPTVSATAFGLVFSVTGTTSTVVDAALPAFDASFVAPVLSLNRRPTTAVSATISVAATEAFNAVLIQAPGAAQYVRVLLPAATTLIGVEVIGAAGASSVATSVNVAVVSGGRVSRVSPLSLQLLGN